MNNDNTRPSTAGITIGLPNSNNKGFDIKAGVIDNSNLLRNTKDRIA